MAIKDEVLQGLSSRRALASLLGLDTAITFKVTSDVNDGIVPALSPVVITADGTATAYVNSFDSSSVTIAETDEIGFTVSDRLADASGSLNVAVMRQAHVRKPLLSETAKAVIAAAPAAALTHIVIEEV